jgi:hypothetical protein
MHRIVSIFTVFSVSRKAVSLTQAPARRLYRHPLILGTARRTLGTMNARGGGDDDNDEFGDSSFLADIDVDQLVENNRRESSAAEENASPNKRPKLQAVSAKSSIDDSALLQTLKDTFGYSAFRHGQAEVIHALLNKRDVAVFWATGQGKSLCYQIPALHGNQTAIVVSPLISLMQDQVHKLNGLSDKPVATFLGSGQLDPGEERRALQGAYNLIYITPEKLAASGFLNQLAQLHASKPIALFAVDEAHCVSECKYNASYREQMHPPPPQQLTHSGLEPACRWPRFPSPVSRDWIFSA